ncbi:MAG: hypothetical protein HRU03_05270 [Nanoarchaeales archaeon]|nr:hypothetical protein [Nanoarchaeales archaeon]
MDKSSIRKYLTENLSKNYSVDDLKGQLVTSGYDLKDIESVLLEFKVKKPNTLKFSLIGLNFFIFISIYLSLLGNRYSSFIEILYFPVLITVFFVIFSFIFYKKYTNGLLESVFLKFLKSVILSSFLYLIYLVFSFYVLVPLWIGSCESSWCLEYSFFGIVMVILIVISSIIYGLIKLFKKSKSYNSSKSSSEVKVTKTPNVPKSFDISKMLNGIFILELLMAFLSFYSGLVLGYVLAVLFIISAFLLRFKISFGFYLTFLLGLFIVLANIYWFFSGYVLDYVSILLSLILISVFFNKKFKDEFLN